jgi:hypothetical protein
MLAQAGMVLYCYGWIKNLVREGWACVKRWNDMAVRIIIGMCALVFLVSCAKEADGPPLPKSVEDLHDFEVVFLSGEAEGEMRPGAGARAVRVGMRFGEKAVLRTLADTSRLDLRLASGSTVRLVGKTVLVFSQLYRDGRLDIEKTGLELLSGSILVKARALVGDSRFQVRTETATVGVRGTEFLVRHEHATGTSVAVQSGRVLVTPAIAMPPAVSRKGEASVEQVRAAAAVELSAGQQLAVTPLFLEAQSRRVAEAVAGAAEADHIRAAEEALRGSTPQPHAAPADLLRIFSDTPGGAANKPPAGEKTGIAGKKPVPTQSLPPDKVPAPAKNPGATADRPLGE